MTVDFKKRYRLGTVAKAVGVPNSTLASWLQREQIELMKGDKQTAGTGDHRLFSWNRVINVAIVAELNRLGVPPSAGSSHLALKFSDIGGAKTAHWVGQEPSELRLTGDVFRDPKSQVPLGRTYFVVRNLEGELTSDVTDNLDHLWFHKNKEASSVIVIDMNSMVDRVLFRLASVAEE
jgi:hypothetical protein